MGIVLIPYIYIYIHNNQILPKEQNRIILR